MDGVRAHQKVGEQRRSVQPGARDSRTLLVLSREHVVGPCIQIRRQWIVSRAAGLVKYWESREGAWFDEISGDGQGLPTAATQRLTEDNMCADSA